MKNLILKIARSKTFNVIGFGLVGVSILSTIGLLYLADLTDKNAKRLYRQTLFQNADSNKDGFISGVEKSNFDSQLFKGKNVYFEGDELKYENGNSVTSDKIIQWINNYNK